MSIVSTLLLAATQILPKPMFGDPTMQQTGHVWGENAAGLASFFVGDDSATGLTVCLWIKTDNSYTYMATPSISAMFSNVPARSTKEGGARLTNLCHDDYTGSAVVPLVNGRWSDNCLPSTYDYPTGLDNWQYGCYVVNVSTDTPLTVNVGGGEVYVPVTNRFIRNVMAESASRAVSIVAESSSANVHFGIAENPLVQFCDVIFTPIGEIVTDDQPLDITRGGIVNTEYRFVVARAKIVNGNMITDIRGYNDSSRLANFEHKTNALWNVSSTFAKDARIRLCLFAIGMGTLKEYDFSIFGMRGYAKWIDDQMIETMRDQDYSEMRRRGIVN